MSHINCLWDLYRHAHMKDIMSFKPLTSHLQSKHFTTVLTGLAMLEGMVFWESVNPIT